LHRIAAPALRSNLKIWAAMRGAMGDDGQSEFGRTWYCDGAALPEPRPVLSFDLDVDVCVIGGGLAGLTVTRELARRRCSVALIEARRLAWNASGRNPGFVLPGFAERIDKVIERIGMPAAKALWALSESGVDYVRDSIAELGIATIKQGRGWLEASKVPATQGVFDEISLIGQELGTEVEFWPTERIRDVLKTNRYHHAVHYPRAFNINPLAYAMALAAAAEGAGAHIFEHTPAIQLDAAGIRKRIVTPKARLRAGCVVLAGNKHIGAVAQPLADALLPITSWTGVTKPLGPALENAVSFSGAISDSRYANYHYRIVGPDRLMWCGAAAAHGFGAKRVRRQLEKAIQATYPQLGPVEFETLWSGESGFAVHRMPQVGEVQPNVWVVSGFGGQGINTTAVAGDLVARAIAENDDTWRLFLPYELVWAGGGLGRMVAQAAIWWSHQKESAAARMAQRREELSLRRRREAGELPAILPRPAYRTVQPPVLRWPPRREVAIVQADEPVAPQRLQPAALQPEWTPKEPAAFHSSPTTTQQQMFSAPVEPAYAAKGWVPPRAFHAPARRADDTSPEPDWGPQEVAALQPRLPQTDQQTPEIREQVSEVGDQIRSDI
jgi:glycine/D-amino acid oxidase-like deaminating enzyme